MARTAKRQLEELTRRGPHDVLHGDLALVGLPGVVFTPRSGKGLPAVAFGHGWMQPPARYRGLLKHLASWGIVAAAPATHKGVAPSHRLFASDLLTTVDICAGVRLGDGQVSVDKNKLGVAGHAMGGGSAVLAAADDERVRAVGTLAVTETRPSMLNAAKRVTVPGLHISGGKDLLAPSVSNAEPLHNAWVGESWLCELKKANHLGFAEGRHWSELVLHGKAQYSTQTKSRALLTAFFLYALNGEERWRDVLEGSCS